MAKPIPKPITLAGIVEHEFTTKLNTKTSVEYIASVSVDGIVVRRKDNKLELATIPWERVLEMGLRITTQMVHVPAGAARRTA